MSLYTCTTTPFWLLGYVSLKIISKNKIDIIRHDHQWPSISKNPSPRISRVWHNPRDSKHIQDRHCTEIYWDAKLYTTEHPTLGSSPETQGSSPEMFYDIAQTTILEILITWWFNPSMSSLSHHCISIFQSSRNFLSPFLNFFTISPFHFLFGAVHILRQPGEGGGIRQMLVQPGTAGHSQV